ncbi:hypothetical protein D3C79_1096430 [compost metagenome]
MLPTIALAKNASSVDQTAHLDEFISFQQSTFIGFDHGGLDLGIVGPCHMDRDFNR